MMFKSLDKDSLLIAGAWLVIECLLFFYFGVNFELESVKYINEADYFREHQGFSQARYLFYSTTIFAIAAGKLIFGSLTGGLVIILLVNLFSYLVFYHSLRDFLGNRLPAILITVLLMLYWPYQVWSLTLYTECLFYSSVVLLFSELLRFRKMDVSFLLRTMLILLIIILSRPLGILFVIPVLVFIFYHLNRKGRLWFGSIALIAAVGFYYVIQVVFTTTPDWNMQRAIQEENLICDMTPPGERSKLDVTDSSNPFYQLAYYVVNNPMHFFRLAGQRLRLFFLMDRSYYNLYHNIFMLGSAIFLYGSILIGFRRLLRRINPSLLMFCGLSVFIFAATIALQCDDYHNRFIMTLMPMLIMLAITAILPGNRIKRTNSF